MTTKVISFGGKIKNGDTISCRTGWHQTSQRYCLYLTKWDTNTL